MLKFAHFLCLGLKLIVIGRKKKKALLILVITFFHYRKQTNRQTNRDYYLYKIMRETNVYNTVGSIKLWNRMNTVKLKF